MIYFDDTDADALLDSYSAEQEAANALADEYALTQHKEPGVTEPGVYESPTGEVYVVKFNKNKTRLYAKRLSHENGTVAFEYAPGVIYDLRPSQKMTAERGKAFSIEIGACCVCGKTLSNPKSVERGIGPVCAAQFA